MSATKRTDELVVGDSVRLHGDPHVVTYLQPAHRDLILVVFDNADAEIFRADSVWELPTQEEIAAASVAARTEGMAQALEHAAALIREHQLAAPKYGIDISVVLDTIAELEGWAAAVGATIGNRENIPSVNNRNVAEFGGLLLHIHAQSMEKYPPEEDGDGPVAGCDCVDCEDLAAEDVGVTGGASEPAPESAVAS